MMDLNTLDYARLDVPEVLLRLFHPRPELSPSRGPPLGPGPPHPGG